MNNLKLTTKKGNEVELRLTEPYKKEVVPKYVNADGDICLVGEEIRERQQPHPFIMNGWMGLAGDGMSLFCKPG